MFENHAYAELSLKYDKEAFIKEYDELLIPYMKPFVPITGQWSLMPTHNQYWKVLDEETYLKYDEAVRNGTLVDDGITHQWRMVNMMQYPGYTELAGGANWRSQIRNRQDGFIKKQFKDSMILKWIQNNIPHKRIVGIHCVLIDPGSFSSVHRDMYWNVPGKPNPTYSNGIFRSGFVVVCLNISDGGRPLLWSLDHEKYPREANADAYIISDYFMHAVAPVETLRRQIRVTVVPDEKMLELVKPGTEVVVPPNYAFTYAANQHQ